MKQGWKIGLCVLCEDAACDKQIFNKIHVWVINAVLLWVFFVCFLAIHCKKMCLEHSTFFIRADWGYGIAHFW